MSKISLRIMQVTLKVKSTEPLGSYLPTLSLLSGSKSWPVITSEGYTMNSDSENFRVTGIFATPNLWHMSLLQDDENQIEVCKRCLCMCISEIGVVLDPAEFEHMIKYYSLSSK